MYRGLWPSGAPSVVFYEVWRLQEVPPLTTLWYRVGPLKKTNTPGSEDRGWEFGQAGNDERIEDGGPVGCLVVWTSFDVGMFGCLDVGVRKLEV